MSVDDEGRRGVLIYIAVVLAAVSIVATVMWRLGVPVGVVESTPFILAAMWVPSLARWIATTTVDRHWQSPLPLKRWGRPRAAIVLVPLATVSAIYLAAYSAAALFNVPRSEPVWHGARLALNVAINLPLLSALGAAGAIGEEFGWRGYLQPRLYDLGAPFAMGIVILVETLFHVPLILLAGYLAGDRPAATIVLFFALGFGLTPVWTWTTYRWQSLWVAIWFHTFHNAISQTILPKALGAGDPLMLGESGILPVASYLAAALVMFVAGRRRHA